MGANVGIWIDHKQAIIVTLRAEADTVEVVKSEVETQLRRTGDSPMKGDFEARQVPRDTTRERIILEQLNAYYDAVITSVRDANLLLILGPGEAKEELKKRMERTPLKDRLDGIETADKMTDRQLAARVREHFGAR